VKSQSTDELLTYSQNSHRSGKFAFFAFAKSEWILGVQRGHCPIASRAVWNKAPILN